MMYDLVGRPEDAFHCADAGVRNMAQSSTPVIRTVLRIHRAFALISLDRTETARDETQGLLELSTVHNSPGRQAQVRMLLSDCALRAGQAQRAVLALVEARINLGDRSPMRLRQGCLMALVDCILDVGAWSVLEEIRESFPADAADTPGADDATGAASTNAAGSAVNTDSAPLEDPEDLVIATRARALLVQADGRLGEAARILESRLTAARSLSVRTSVARYLHHLASVDLAITTETGSHGARDTDAARAAAALFAEAAEVLPFPGYGYFRARALLGLACASAAASEPEAAADAMAQALAIAREIKAPGLVADCLRERSRRRIRVRE
jgi:hypothetical protein